MPWMNRPGYGAGCACIRDTCLPLRRLARAGSPVQSAAPDLRPDRGDLRTAGSSALWGDQVAVATVTGLEPVFGRGHVFAN